MDAVLAQAIRQRLEEIKVAGEGRLTPEAVVEDAKDKTSPLHGQFVWNLKEAAHQQWLNTARQLIRSVRVVVTEETVSRAPVYVRDPRAERHEQGYVALYDMVSDEEAARAIVNREFERAASALNRAQEVSGVLGLRSMLDDLLEQLVLVQHRVKKAA